MPIGLVWFFLVGSLTIGLSVPLILVSLLCHFGLTARIKPDSFSAQLCEYVTNVSKRSSERKKKRVEQKRTRLNSLKR